MDQNRKQVIDRLQKANNVLITVSRNPSVDQLSSALGLALMLNKMGKHAVAVFSGNAPSTLEFLQPEKTFEKNTDSLRDFIISLDKSKADKLRYKVENNLVRVFITPYKTSLTQDDLEFSQGDFNVDVVVALGVHEQPDIDQAITAHGRILHDATVIAVNKDKPGSLGSINWSEPGVSSLCEMITTLSSSLKEGILDNQISTALLTGIVAETDRFSNDKTKPSTMQASSALMAAGANQQLVATKLQAPVQSPAHNGELPEVKKSGDGSLEIAHSEPEADDEAANNQIHIDEQGQIGPVPEPDKPTKQDDKPKEPAVDDAPKPTGRGLTLQPPTFSSKLTANSEPEHLDPSVDIVGSGAIKPDDKPMLSRRKPEDKTDSTDDDKGTEPQAMEPQTVTLPEPPKAEAPEQPEQEEEQSLTDLEQQVKSPHVEIIADKPKDPDSNQEANEDGLGQAREAVLQASEDSQSPPEPIQALNAQPMELSTPPPETQQEDKPNTDGQNVESDPGLPPGLSLQGGGETAQVSDPTAPPPVPPPMMPQPDQANSSLNPQ